MTSIIEYKGVTLEDVNQINTMKDIKAVAKKLGVKGYTTWKKKDKSIDFYKRKLVSEIEEERKEGEEEESKAQQKSLSRDEEEAKEKIVLQISALTGENPKKLRGKSFDFLNKTLRNIEDAETRLVPAESTGGYIPTAQFEDEVDDNIRRQSRAKDILDESGLVDMPINKDKLMKSIINGNMKAFEAELSKAGIPVDDIKALVPVANKLNKAINKQSLQDGSWLSKGMAVLGAPELALWQNGMKAIGLNMSAKDTADLQALINGEYKGSTTEAMGTLFKASANPDAWGNMLSMTAKKRLDRVGNSFTDIFSKDDIYKEREAGEEGVQGIIRDRKATLKEQEKRARELWRLQGKKDEDYAGPVYREDKDFEKAITPVHLSEYGGKDDYSGWAKVGNFFKELGIGIAEELLDPFGFIEIVNGKAVKTDKLKELERQLKEKDPRKYAEYQSQINSHMNALQKASVKDRNQAMIDNHKPVAKQLGNVIRDTLEENARLIREGKPPLLSPEKVKEYIGYRDMLSSGNVTYHQLARITNRFDSDVPMDKLPQNLKEKTTQWKMEEETMLKSQGAGDSNLNVSGDEVANEELRNIQRAKENQMEAEKQIKQKAIDDFNREVIKSRTDAITTGYVDTDNKNRAELRPRIVFGDTDGQLNPSPAEVLNDEIVSNSMMMWQTTRTENNSTDNPLLQRQLRAESNLLKETFPMPSDNGFKRTIKQSYNQKRGMAVDYSNYNRVPEAYLKYSTHKLIPVYAPISESLPLMVKPEQATELFTQSTEPERDVSINMRVDKAVMPNRFPETRLKTIPPKNRVLNRMYERRSPFLTRRLYGEKSNASLKTPLKDILKDF